MHEETAREVRGELFGLRVNHYFTPPHLQSLHYCNTIARPLRNERLLVDPPLVSHTPNRVSTGSAGGRGGIGPQRRFHR